MSTQSEIIRLSDARDTIRNKMVNLGIGLATDKLDTLATKLEGMANNGAVSSEVKEGESYTIPAGYHNGSGVVKGIAGGGNYNLQEKTVTPTKSTQSVTSDDGYYGLSGVTVNPIPDSYQDVSATTATAATVLATKVFTAADGTTTAGTMPNNGALNGSINAGGEFTIPAGYTSGGKVTGNSLASQTDGDAVAADVLLDKIAWVDGLKVIGSMPNNGAVSVTLDTTTTSYTVAKGFHSGSGKVSLVLEEKTATPTTSSQSITPTSGKVLSKVTVNAIPSNYKDATNVTAVASEILSGKKAIGKDASGNIAMVTGSMTNQGAKALTIDGLTTTSVTIPAGYHNGSGSVSLTSDIEEALAAI